MIELWLVVMNVFNHFPVFTIAFTTAVIGGAILALLRKWIAYHLLTSHHEVAFPIFLQIGVIYAVLLAFMCSMVLTDTAEAYKEVKEETTNLLTLAQLAPGFGPDVRKKINSALIEYTKIVINEEWPKMVKGQEEPNASKALSQLQHIYLNLNPQSSREEAIYAESLAHLAILREGRRMRLFIVEEPNSNYPWVFLSMLGLLVVSVAYFFGMKHLWTQIWLTGTLIFTIASILAVILVLSHPFSGKYGITARVFETTLIRLEEISLEQP